MWLSKAENVTVTLIAETVDLISYFAIYNLVEQYTSNNLGTIL
jgi:hypothetical protein